MIFDDVDSGCSVVGVGARLRAESDRYLQHPEEALLQLPLRQPSSRTLHVVIHQKNDTTPSNLSAHIDLDLDQIACSP